ncbi:type IV secretion system DNA-binding domain-containing protein [Polaribacter pectinis]|uniref:Type IV secretion system DNA-binding domain-containing protein n=1 Tax=Polaribacter pectinis TaxID=2738844 RepID=A0A7G9L8F7_9FLAO|nr:type IV secretion system DNA-binding domain-containing protein [Polaribacter pectinis]QNM84906.1 type IV secretion system DNA-binding domain-containing protein [Polaribacter pectinis]
MKPKRNPNITYFAVTNWRERKDLFGIKQEDRAFHTYILGKTGAGKSNLLITKILQDIKHKRGACVFDVHGDLINTISLNIPHYRKDDVIYLNIPDGNLTFGYNPLKRVSYEKRSLVASAILDSFQKLWSGAWGIKMEHILRYILLTLLDQPKANMRDIIRILQDEEYRKKCINNVVNPDVKNFWLKEYDKYGKNDVTPILNKVGAFLVHPTIKRLLIDNADSLSFRKIMDEKKILLVNISKGSLGVDVANILGSLLLSTITSASFNRIDTEEHLRVPFHLYLDEFQNYTNKTLTEMLSELRKFKVTLTLAHQYLHQLSDDIRYGVLGNVGTVICFRIGAVDAEYMLMEHYIEFLPLTLGDYVNMENYHVYVKLMIDGKPSKPFSAITVYYKTIL